jgi:hypothetical protein
MTLAARGEVDFAARVMVALGTKLTSRDVRSLVAIGGHNGHAREAPFRSD